MKKAIVIGSGFSGCMFAMMLKEKNWDVTLIEKSNQVGEILAKRAKEKNINDVYFDRGPYKYHGRIKIFAETLRKNGLKF